MKGLVATGMFEKGAWSGDERGWPSLPVERASSQQEGSRREAWRRSVYKGEMRKKLWAVAVGSPPNVN